MDIPYLFRRLLDLFRRGHVCPRCRGTGGTTERPCGECGGRGRL